VSYKLTDEQQAIVHHPLGKHARILAVAGSGKTTTMVHRVHHLVMEWNQDPRRIRIVLFNRLAREDFQKKLENAIFEVGKRPIVLTFHALAFRMRLDAEKQGLLPRSTELWTGDKQELALFCMHRAIDSLLHEGIIEENIDPLDALDTVGLWKACLIPPERAGHRTNPDLPLVYRRFEEFREEKRALTFDDFVPKALELMASHPRFRKRWTNQMDHLIVDEYQDINYGQQEMIRLLAGKRADVMVVGDDDQTIYEWRAARPRYILEGFKNDFVNKPVVDYQLSHSFRFGPLVAQVAFNTIGFNQQREPKPLVAYDAHKLTGIYVLALPLNAH
jgi:DNA helicase-2/ATP-dependent DNA helicase PcrA